MVSYIFQCCKPFDFFLHKKDTYTMEVSFDYWQGESLSTVIQNIAEFRKQVLIESDVIQCHSLSDEINYLQHYFDSESTVIVANDCGKIVGYISLVNDAEHHNNLTEFAYYGTDLVITQGPIVHKDYRGQGIGKGLIMEALNACQNRLAEALILDPTNIIQETSMDAINNIVNQFSFTRLDNHTDPIYYLGIDTDVSE